jgi:hypothetical protein
MSDRPLWTKVSAADQDGDIRIIDLDLARTTWSRVHESMRVMHLRLNRQPDTLWIRFFHEERESRIGVRRRGLWIEDGFIAFDCLAHEVESHHLPDIRRSLEFANARHREHLDARRRERAEGAAAGQAELRELEALRDRLRSSFGTPPAPPAAQPAAKAGIAAAAKPDAKPKASPLAPDPAVAAAHDAAAAAMRPVPRARPKSGAEGVEETLEAFRKRLRDARPAAPQSPGGPPKKSR